MRLDRIITLNLVGPLHRFFTEVSPSPLSGTGRGDVLPVLMYHSISDRDESHLRDYFKVCTSPMRFREQMQTLKENGFTGVDLQTGLAWLNRNNETIGAPASGPAATGNRVIPVARDESEISHRRREEADLLRPEGAGSPESLGRLNDSPPSPLRGEGRGEVLDSASCLPPPAFSPLQPVVITFDDGFQDFFTEAVPVMREHGFTATMYLPTAFIGDTRRPFFPRRSPIASRPVPPSTLNSNLSTAPACLTWSEVCEARSAGMTFGSHTVNHPKLHGMPWHEIESELRDSRRTLEDHLGEAVPDFAYPYAFPEADREFCERFRDSVEAAGYATNVTTIIGRLTPDDDPYTLRRLPMNGADDGQLLRAKLAGHYDWLAFVQSSLKRAKKSVVARLE